MTNKACIPSVEKKHIPTRPRPSTSQLPGPPVISPSPVKKTPAVEQAALDNRSRQLNPKDIVYWQSRGLDDLPGVPVFS
jgi:hypothetical protein